MKFSNRISWLRLVAVLEGISYLALGVTMPLKYYYGMPQPNYVVGMAHGLLFVLYIGLVFSVFLKYNWKLITLFWALVASIVPFGTFVADHKIFRRMQK